MKAMIFAAGLGTRFKPWTDEHPKALALVNGKSLLERNILYLQQFGIHEVIVNVHHFADQLIDAIVTHDGWGANITISDESDEVLETGGGLKKASWFFSDGPFVVMNADILTDLNLNGMIAFHQEHHPLATLAVTNRSTSRYFLFNESGRLCGWRNTKTHEERLVANNTKATQDMTAATGHARPILKEKAFSGIHVISPEIFPLIHREGKFSMVDVYLELAGNHSIFEYDHSGTKLIDVGKREAVQIAESLFP